MNGYWDDTEREEGVIERVSGPDHGYYDVKSSNGWSCGVSAEYGVEPKVGDRFVTWGSFGRPMRGQAINDHVLYYRTPEEQAAEDAKEVEQRKVEQRKAARVAEYESKRATYDARVAALPAPLRARVEQFRAFRGDAWRWEFEPYELVCCEEAASLAAHFATGDALKAFAALSHDEQQALYTPVDDGHSGNTWGQSLRFAWHLLERPEVVPQLHGALCPLIGCDDYGCYSVRAP